MSNVVILGLGAIGSLMARRLLDAGHTVAVYNRTPEAAAPLLAAGATAAASPREAASQGAEFVLSMVTDDDASRRVWLDSSNGALAGMAAGSVAIECSTLTPAWTRELAAACAQRGVGFVEAPVVGSRPQAEAGQLVLLVSAAEEARARTEALLKALGGRSIVLGDTPGQGATLKLLVNTLFAIQATALGELLGFAQRTGLPEATVVEALASLPVLSPAAAGLLKGMHARDFAPLFPVALVEKDLRYALETAAAVGARLPSTAAAHAVVAEADARGHGGEHLSAVARVFLS